MKEGLTIGKAIASVFLLMVFLFPTAIQFSHACDGHETISCKEKSVHLHKKASECHICDFHFFSFNYDFSTFPEFVKAIIPSRLVNDFTTSFTKLLLKNNTSLRAPPSFLA
ncbi:hypothetical protein KO500_04455 [Cellulophaga baltica]|uniref:hypothetical protein n=1 Tax=Cellulophaga TaxID=104264 RepID=UPI001C07216E|nr:MULTISPECIES: hypothetical protein [Cellulophaga]MBU2995668.1 hypothetical protein [Cellulophaga baltica]MDO6767062.1 hypothetical protein [Cellulophaga sp. 1_MG-2023]